MKPSKWKEINLAKKFFYVKERSLKHRNVYLVGDIKMLIIFK